MNKHKISVPLLTFSLFAQTFFYGFCIITGRRYGGATEDSSFITFMMIVDLIPLFLFFKYLLSNYSKKGVVAIIAFLIGYLALLLIEGNIKYTTVKAFIAFSFPAALTGVLLAKYKAGELFAKWLEPLMLFLSWVGVSSMSVIMSVSILEAGNEGIGIQSLSYYCAFAFSLNLYFLLFGDEIGHRFKYSNLLLYRIISIALLVVQVVVTLSSGGRGGFVLLISSAVLLLLLRIFRPKRSARKGGSHLVPTAILIILATVITIKYMPESIETVIDAGSERTFSYLSNGKIDMGETSNRDIVYGYAIQDIRQKPVFGYGLLMKGTHIEGSWPHNIVLELLLQGGYVFLVAFLAFFILVLRKLRLMIKNGHGLFIIPVFLYPMIMLCFSGSYISTGLFWFSISYVLCYELPSKSFQSITAN